MNGSTIDNFKMNGASIDSPTMNGPTIDSPTINGSSIESPAMNGSSIDSPTMNGSSIDNSPTIHPTTNGSTVNGLHTNGLTVNGGLTNGSTVNSTNTNGVHANGEPANGVASAVEPIAICGMALRFPGGLKTPQQFWEFLLAKGDARGRVPASRYNIDTYYSPDGKPGTVKTEYGYFLDESVDLGSLDVSFFSIKGGEVDRVDPQQRQMLEVTRECIEDAGETNYRGQVIGCYMGSFGEDWCEMFSREPQQYGLYRVTGYGDFMLPNRVSYEMDLKGPRYVRDSHMIPRGSNNV